MRSLFLVPLAASLAALLLLSSCAGFEEGSSGQGRSAYNTSVRDSPDRKSAPAEATGALERTQESLARPTAQTPEGTPRLQEKLQKTAARSGVRVGIVVRGLDGRFAGEEASVNGGARFRSASLIKLLILLELLRQVDVGKVSLDEPLGGSTVGELAAEMISYSDNSATNLLIDRIGQNNVNALARNLELEETHLGRKMLDFQAAARGEDNYTSASDVAEVLARIYSGDTLSASSRRFALMTLANQHLNTKIPPALPQDAQVLHKTGELPAMEGQPAVEHDAGIVILPEGSFIIAALTEGDPASGITAIQNATSASYRALSKGK